jgi:hypothetical protein
MLTMTKRGPGRPKGSKNSKPAISDLLTQIKQLPKTHRGGQSWLDELTLNNPAAVSELEQVREAYQAGEIVASFPNIAKLINDRYGLALKANSVRRYLKGE